MTTVDDAAETLAKCPRCQEDEHTKLDPSCPLCQGSGLVAGKIAVGWSPPEPVKFPSE